jgi:hypothetical protein
MSIINKPSLTEIQLAERWNITTKTLQNWRKIGKGPRYLKIGRAVRYPHELVEQFERENLTASTSQGAEG